MKGPELVRILQDLGFDKIKTHMAVLDDADQMLIEVRLGAFGYSKTATPETPKKKGPVKKKTGPIKKKAPVRKKEPAEAEAAAEASPIRKKLPIRKKAVAAEETVATETAAENRAAVIEAPTVETETRIETPEAPPEPLPETQDREAPVETAPPPSPPEEEAGAEAAEVPPPPPPAAERMEEERASPVLEPPTRRAEPAPTAEGSEEEGAEPPSEEKREEDGSSAPVADEPQIRRLPQPERRAKILGRIELPKETIADATRRSAPGGPRNPANVDRNLRKAAMEQFRSRGAKRGPATTRRQGPGFGMGRGPGGGRGRSGASVQKKRKDPLAPPPGIDPTKLVQVEAPVSVKKLSEALGHRVNELLVVLFRLGVRANINSYLDKDQVELVALELNRNVEVVEERAAEDELLASLTEDAEKITDKEKETRPPIVTFMGHVDHGKTSLLDKLRASKIAADEAGGITQHIGAYKVERGDHTIVVLDTPGHEAFTSMRARGAKLTDIVVLVVAADDGVMPQTEEALNHAKAAGTPVIVAVNKCDRPEANPMRVRQQLATLGLQPEEWGGQTQFVDTSALTGEGLDELVEKIALEAMVLELKAHPESPASGTVIEAKQTPAQGNVISLMVMDGTLRKGDHVLCGHGTGRIRIILDDHGRQIDTAPPGTPVEVLGLPELPVPGDPFYVVKDSKMAKEVAQQRAAKLRAREIAEKSRARLADLKEQLQAQKVEEIRLILKADVMGSLEPIRQALEKLSNEEVGVRILHSALGGISETDVALADASDAIIIGFNSVADEKARARAETTGIKIRFYNVIYELLDDVRKAMEGMLSPEQREEVRGHAEIRKIFRSSKFGNIAGCYVQDGKIGRNNQVRVVRDGVVVYTGKIAGLRREKDDVREVRENFECGIKVEGYDDIKEGDILEAFEVVEIKRTLADIE